MTRSPHTLTCLEYVIFLVYNLFIQFSDADHNDSDSEDGRGMKKVSNKEANKLTGKALRKSFNSQGGIVALSKFLAICKENTERDLVADYLQAGGSLLEILRLLDTSEKKNLSNANAVFSAMHLIIMKCVILIH